MNITLAFILYVAVFRLAIVISAIISIVLGYYLFCRGVWPEEKLEHGTDVETRVAGTRLTLKNAAPGTCFALFGVVIIGLMFARGAPELNLKGLGGVKAQTVRSDTDEEISWSDLTRKGIEYESQGNTAYGSPIFKAVPKKQCKALYRALTKSLKSPESAVGEGSGRSNVEGSVAVPQ